MNSNHNSERIASSQEASFSLTSPLFCPICLNQVDRLVRDHNHLTGIIRGRICERCNSWLGILEKHPESYYLRKKPGRRRWRRWVYANAERIAWHLQQSTGEVYPRRRGAVRIPQNTGMAPVTTTGSGAGESRANNCSNHQPKTEGLRGVQDSSRLAWAKNVIRMARGLLPDPADIANAGNEQPHPCIGFCGAEVIPCSLCPHAQSNAGNDPQIDLEERS